MADTKISDLTAITGANTAADDDFVIVDTSAAQTKRITRDELRVGLYPGIDDNSSATAVTIDASGHVGIGTSSPAEALDVSGNILVTSENATPLHVDRSTSTGSATIRVSNSTDTSYFGTPIGGGFAIDDDANLSSGPWLRIDTSGNVGIGTASPDSALHVYKQTNDRSARFQRSSTQHIDITQTSGVNEIKSTGKNFEIGTTDALDLKFDTNNVERMRIDGSGNVGIGTSSPSEALTVAGGAIQLKGSTYTDFSDYWGTNDNTAIFTPYGYLGSNGAYAVSLFSNGYRNSSGGFTSMGNGGLSTASGIELNPSGVIQFRTGTPSGTTVPESMRIDGSGNVGIGTSSPDANLEVEETAGAATVNVRGSTDSIVRARQTGNTGNGYFSFGDSADIFVGGMQYDHAGDNMRFSVNNAERIRIDSTGKVGIGTSSPSYSLSVGASNNGIYSDSDGFYITQNTSNLDVLSLQSNGIVEYRSDENNVTTATGHIFYNDGSEKMRIDSSGVVDILGGTVELNGNQITGIQVTIADNAFATITPTGRYGGYLSIVAQSNGAFPQHPFSAFLYSDFGSSPTNILVQNGASFEVSVSGPPTGTTGTDGKVTLFAGGTSGTFYLENRTGSNYTFQITLT